MIIGHTQYGWKKIFFFDNIINIKHTEKTNNIFSMHYKLLRSKSNNMNESLNKVEIPFHLRLENSLKGWENADAIGLDRIGQRVGKLFKSLTCRKVLNNYDEFGRKWSNKVYEENEKKEVVELFEKIGSYDIPIIEIVRKLRDNIFASQDWKESNEIELMLNKILDLRLGASFYNQLYPPPPAVSALKKVYRCSKIK